MSFLQDEARLEITSKYYEYIFHMKDDGKVVIERMRRLIGSGRPRKRLRNGIIKEYELPLGVRTNPKVATFLERARQRRLPIDNITCLHTLHENKAYSNQTMTLKEIVLYLYERGEKIDDIEVESIRLSKKLR